MPGQTFKEPFSDICIHKRHVQTQLRLLANVSPTCTMSLPANALVGLRTDGEKVEIIDQLLLPHVKKYISFETIDDAFEAIKSIKVIVVC